MSNTPPTDGPVSFPTKISRFFFAEETPYALAVIRQLLPTIFLVAMLQRWPHVRELFSSDGAPAPFDEVYGRPGLIPIPNATVALTLYGAMICLFATAALGWKSRVSVLGSGLLMTYFTTLDMMTTMTKFSVISTHAFLLLACSDCGAVWSLDARNRTGNWAGINERGRTRPSALWPRRLIQCLVACYYFGSSVTKIHLETYFTGDQLQYWLLTNLNFPNPVGERLSMYPVLVVAMCHITAVWEAVFPFVCWKGWSRAATLSLGMVFHLMTLVTMGLIAVPFICITLLASFFDERDYRDWFPELCGPEAPALLSEREKSLALLTENSEFGWASWGKFGGWLAFSMLVGLGWDYWSDPYQARDAAGLPKLEPVPAEVVAQLFQQDRRLEPQDKLFSFDIGSTLIADRLLTTRKEFKRGEQVILQCNLTPPHTDLYLDASLKDAEGKIVDHMGQVVNRERLRGNMTYTLGQKLVPGDYFFTIRIDGQEVAQRHFHLFEEENVPQVLAPRVISDERAEAEDLRDPIK